MLTFSGLSQFHKFLGLQAYIAPGNVGANDVAPGNRQKQVRGILGVVVNRNRVGRLPTKMLKTRLVDILWLIVGTADFENNPVPRLEEIGCGK
jgi:hypothetical protein